MQRRSFSVFAGVLTGLSVLSAAAGPLPPLSPQSFEKQMTSGVASLNRWDGLYQNKEGLWYRQFMSVSRPVVDVIKSESALRPLVGTFKAQVKVMFGAPQMTQQEAKLETSSEEYAGGLNEYTIDYDLKFVPKGKAWVFSEGTSYTSLQKRVGRTTPVALTPEDLSSNPSVHTQIVEMLSRSSPASRKVR